MEVFTSVDPSFFVSFIHSIRFFSPLFIQDFLPLSLQDVDSRDAVGETLLHWAARCTNPETIEALVLKGFDVNSREFTRGRTPLFMAATKEIAAKLISLGADQEIIDTSGTHRRNQPGTSAVPERPKLPDGTKPMVVTVAIVGGDRARNTKHTTSEAVILGCTVSETTPRPAMGVTGNDQLRPERFAWSQRRLDFEEGLSRYPGELPLIWAINEKDQQQQLCVRLGDIEWFKSRKVRFREFVIHFQN